MKSLKDLEGRRVGLVTGSIQHLLWPAFARASGIDASKVEVVNVDVQTYVQQWSSGQFDAANTGLGTYETVAFDRQGRLVGSGSGAFPGIDAEEPSVQLPLLAEAVSRLRVHVDGFHGLGGGLAEIAVR